MQIEFTTSSPGVHLATVRHPRTGAFRNVAIIENVDTWNLYVDGEPKASLLPSFDAAVRQAHILSLPRSTPWAARLAGGLVLLVSFMAMAVMAGNLVSGSASIHFDRLQGAAAAAPSKFQKPDESVGVLPVMTNQTASPARSMPSITHISNDETAPGDAEPARRFSRHQPALGSSAKATPSPPGTTMIVPPSPYAPRQGTPAGPAVDVRAVNEAVADVATARGEVPPAEPGASGRVLVVLPPLPVQAVIEQGNSGPWPVADRVASRRPERRATDVTGELDRYVSKARRLHHQARVRRPELQEPRRHMSCFAGRCRWVYAERAN